MEELSKNINTIENNVAKYIYKKYIMTTPIDTIPITSLTGIHQTPQQTSHQIQQLICTKTKTEKQSKLNKLDTKMFNIQYKSYLQTLFNFDRITFRITQEDVIKQDYKQMALSNKAYNFNKANFNPREYEILPDILRCKFIRKYKHRYYRCLNKCIQNIPQITSYENDEDLDEDLGEDLDEDLDDHLCYIHETCYNLYLDKYNELLKLYIHNT